ncbi:MAG TPA: type II toxin-antitoxin system HigB family toxin [Tepidisphaeraceae bacterium]|nr:type II toxin-antitoxin system HigB family toxin [Tepidisphaeraceae bacterium]
MVNERALQKFARKHRDAASWLSIWAINVRGAAWRSLIDVRKSYPSADGVKLRSGFVITIFNVKGNEYRLLSHIDYVLLTVTVIECLTHDEYDEGRWKD